MITLSFKNVGQGDSIIIEWFENGKECIGIVDCHVYHGTNPSLDHIKTKKLNAIEFIILSHFHYDHFSGMPDLFDYCSSHNIKVKYFYHSLAPFIGELYNRIFTSQKIQTAAERFLVSYDNFEKQVGDSIPVNSQTNPFVISNKIKLSFHAPIGKVYHKMAKQLSRKINKITSSPADINKLSTILSIQNNQDYILLTSDAEKKTFINLDIPLNAILVQAPHHGSWKNIHPEFWDKLKRNANCPIIFSVGDEPKDKLPNKETISFFDKNKYEIYSTNNVYGIEEHFKSDLKSNSNTKSMRLNSFSILRKERTSNPISKFQGDKNFELLL